MSTFNKKNIKVSFFESSDNIQNQKSRIYCLIWDNEFSTVNLNKLALNLNKLALIARKLYCNFENLHVYQGNLIHIPFNSVTGVQNKLPNLTDLITCVNPFSHTGTDAPLPSIGLRVCGMDLTSV